MKPIKTTRLLKEVKDVLYDKSWVKKAHPDLILYYMERGVKKNKDLRYDITLIPALKLGKESNKTKGNKNNKGYEELYTVLKGEAIFLLQKGDEKTIKDVVAVKAKPKQWIRVLPDYYAITINPSAKKDLKIGNWVSEKNENIYEDIEKAKGACYFYTADGWIKNKNYKKVPKLRFEKPLNSRPKNLDFLRHPNATNYE